MSAQASSRPLHLASLQYCGLIPREQQDALLAVGQVLQADDLSPCQASLTSSAGLCAVADGVAVSFKPQLASRALLEILRDAEQGRVEHWQDGWIGPRALRRFIHPRLCRKLSRQPALHPSATTLALLQWRDGHYSALGAQTAALVPGARAAGDQRGTAYPAARHRGPSAPGRRRRLAGALRGGKLHPPLRCLPQPTRPLPLMRYRRGVRASRGGR